MLSSFSVHNFRGFSHIKLPSLGPINLIVGRNNTGKTSLLEALFLASLRDREQRYRAVGEVLDHHDEIDSQRGIFSVEGIFHGRKPRPGERIQLGPVDGTALEIVFGERKATAPATIERTKQVAGWLEVIERRSPFPNMRLRDLVLSLIMEGGTIENASPDAEERAAILVRSGGVDDEALSRWWDSVATTDAEEHVLDCMRILAPSIQKIALVANRAPGSDDVVVFGSLHRRFVLRLADHPDPMPLRALGDGVSRIFEFALALQRARGPQLLLIDEVENGIHHSALPTLWRFLIEAARRSDVQIFATTHSWDCIKGYKQALDDIPDADGRLIRLERRSQGVELKAVVYGRAELESAVIHEIEVR